MIGKLKNIVSLFFLTIFLFPSFVKITHHHEDFECNAKGLQHLHESHEKCAVCNFEFSVFSIDFEHFILQKTQVATEYLNNYCSAKYTSSTDYPFLLRAPPFVLI
jgi:hypothetical protein